MSHVKDPILQEVSVGLWAVGILFISKTYNIQIARNIRNDSVVDRNECMSYVAYSQVHEQIHDNDSIQYLPL